MKEKIKQSNKMLFASIALMFAALIILVVSVTSLPMGVAKANSNEKIVIVNGQYDEYTNSDSFVHNGINHTIDAYDSNPTLRYGNSVITRNDFSGKYNLDVGSDNAIVQIVPKELFTAPGDYLYIGKEYGFFINTVNCKDEISDAPTQNKKSIVYVFDIIMENVGLEDRAGVFEVTVKPLFQREYVFLDKSESQYNFKKLPNYSQYTASYSITSADGYVVAHSVLNGNGPNFTLDYDYEVKEYYLKDISYIMSLSNEQDANDGYGAEHYNPYSDTGSYFTYFDYKYQGTARRNGEFPKDETVELAKTCVDLGLSLGKKAVQSIPIFGTIISGIELAFEVVDGIKAINHYATGMENYLNASDVSVNNGVVTATNYFSNRDDQISNYGHLVKTAAAIVQTTPEDDGIWYKPGDSATGYFKVGHSALNGQHKNYTRIQSQIALKVVQIDEKEVAFEYGAYDFAARTPEYKNLNIDKTEYLYLQENGTNYFNFSPLYTGNYDLAFSTGQDISLYLNGNKIQGSLVDGTQNYDLLLDGGSNNQIVVKANDKGCIAPFKISPNSNVGNISVPANKDYLIKSTI